MSSLVCYRLGHALQQWDRYPRSTERISCSRLHTVATSRDRTKLDNSAIHPLGVGKWVVIHVMYMDYGVKAYSVVDWGVVRQMAAQLRVQSPLRGLWALLTCAAWGTTYYSSCQSVITSTIVKRRWHWICSVKRRYTKYLGFSEPSRCSISTLNQ